VLPRAELERMDAAMAKADAERAAAQAAADAASPKRVAFLGDSYTGGSGMDSGQEARWPALVSAELNWIPEYFTAGGSGFLQPGLGEPFGDRVDAVIAAGPRIVVIAGGLNDADRFPAEDIGVAAGEVFQRIRAGLPHARIVAIGPFHPSTSPPPSLLQARDAIRAATGGITGLNWIDPLPWFAAGEVEIGSDRTHPTDTGHRALADKLIPALKGLGFGPPPA
jgi:lysophospholipase L1-like esterase